MRKEYAAKKKELLDRTQQVRRALTMCITSVMAAQKFETTVGHSS